MKEIPPYLTPHNTGTVLFLKVHPGAKHDAFGDEHDGRLKISLTAPPVDGKANQALIAFLAKKLGLAKSSLEITAGETSRRKSVLFKNISIEELLKLLKEKAA